MSKRGIIVTGGGHGIGEAIVREYLHMGMKVCYIDHQNKLDLESENLFFYKGDLSQQNDLDSFVSFCHEHLDRVDILVNNACRSHKGILSGCDYEQFQHALSVGLTAPYYLSLKFKEDLMKTSGNIINIASSRAFQSEPDTESYTSSKGGIVALTHAMSVSLSGKVRVNCIAPGWIDVNNTVSFSKEDETAIPVGRVGKPRDIVSMVKFLCSSEAGFINGETFTIDGGMNKRMIYHGDHGWTYSCNDE